MMTLSTDRERESGDAFERYMILAIMLVHESNTSILDACQEN